MEIRLEEQAWKDMKETTEDRFPEEASGLLLGEVEDEVIQIKELVKTKNILGSSTEFKIDPQVVFDTMEDAEGEDWNLVGFFHSHPNLAPYMSGKDKKFMKLWLNKVWLIAGTDQQGKVTDTRAFTWRAGDFEEVEIRKS